MKTTQISKNILLVSGLLLVTACAESKMLGTVRHDRLEMTEKSARSQDITFKKGKLIEVAYLSVKKGKERLRIPVEVSTHSGIWFPVIPILCFQHFHRSLSDASLYRK